MVRRVKVFAPATIANLGPGFDVFGLALAEPVDAVEARKSKRAGIRVTEISGVGAGSIPRKAGENTSAIAASEVMKLLGRNEGIELRVEKGIKPRGGIGSSGASAVAGAAAANELYDGELSDEQLIEAAARAEEKIAGSIHYDNVTAAMMGGFTIVTSTDPLEFLKIDPPPMKVVVAQPAVELATKLGRKLLPQKVLLRDAVANVGRASTMVAALKAGDLETLGKCMVDSVAEPVRAPLIPGFLDVKRSALDAGAVGAAMAGSGPSVFAIVKPKGNAEPVARAMAAAFERAGVKCETVITSPGEGVRVQVLERE